MKNLLKKLHIMSNRSENEQGSSSSKGSKSNLGSSSSSKKILRSKSTQSSEQKPLSGLSSWLHSVANRQSSSPPPSLSQARGERMEPSDAVTSGGLDVVSDSARLDSASSASRDPEVEEEYQIQLALELSAKEDPEAVQIEAVKQISLGSCDPGYTPAEVVAYRYWVSHFIHILLVFMLLVEEKTLQVVILIIRSILEEYETSRICEEFQMCRLVLHSSLALFGPWSFN